MAASNTGGSQFLKAPCRCVLCGERMEVGEPFKWYEKSAIRASKYRTIPARYVPRHRNDCVIERREAEQLERDRQVEFFTARLAALVASGDSDAALALIAAGPSQ